MKRPCLVVAVSDMHMGSAHGLLPPEGVRGPNGNPILPNAAQVWSWGAWEKFWGWVMELKRAVRPGLHCDIYLGDLFEANKFIASSESISPHHEPQDYIGDRVLGCQSLPWALKPDHRFVIRGTTAHVGESGESEEAFARKIKAERPGRDAWSWQVCRLVLHGKLLDFRHHPSNSGSKPWTQASAVVREAKQVFYEHVEKGERPPDIAIRGHVHTYADSYNACRTRAITLPPWQLKTGYGHQRVSNAIPQVGGVAVVLEPNGTYEIHDRIFQPTLEEPWRPKNSPA